MADSLTVHAKLVEEASFKTANDYDVIVYINDDLTLRTNSSHLDLIHKELNEFAKVNKNIAKEVTVLPLKGHSSGRMVYSPILSLNKDTDDIRRVYEAANAGIKKALSIDCRKILLVVGALSSAPKNEAWTREEILLLNAVLGAYHALYQPLEIREAFPDRSIKVDMFGVLTKNAELLKVAYALEEGRRITRDIMGSDPERMAAPKVVEYIENEFKAHSDTIKLTAEKIDAKKYPLMAAVNRAAASVPRHDGRVVKMEYIGKEATENIYLIGKGITYDTGGTDVKANGVMAGMHRDKGGAAGVAGFMKMLALLKPDGIAVHGKMAFVRNSIGEESYVADEIITSRSGVRVRVGNTDAEGRMVMSDILCEAKEEALNVTNPFMFTWATLTGHVIRAYGDAYSAVMDNGPARDKKVASELKILSETISDLTEISTIRREDFEAHKGKSEYEDVIQSNNLPSSATPRGHQSPAAFMIMASGLDKHGKDSNKPLPYTHVDVAGSAGSIYTLPTASPTLMFAAKYILPRIKF